MCVPLPCRSGREREVFLSYPPSSSLIIPGDIVRMTEVAEVTEGSFSAISGDTPYVVANFPLPSTSDYDIREPHAPYMASSSDPLTSDSPRESYLNATPNGSGMLLANKHESYAEEPILPNTSSKSKRRSVVLVVLLLVALALIIVAVIVPVYFTVIKPKLNEATSKSNSPGSGGGSSPKSGGPGGSTPTPGSPNAITGGDGSTVYAADGTTFIYHNSFGGFCKCFTDFIFLLNWKLLRRGFEPGHSCDY